VSEVAAPPFVIRASRFLRTFGLPLLAKELTEQAARPRTYKLRVGYALLLYFGAFLCFLGSFGSTTVSPMAILGHGRGIFKLRVDLSANHARPWMLAQKLHARLHPRGLYNVVIVHEREVLTHRVHRAATARVGEALLRLVKDTNRE